MTTYRTLLAFEAAGLLHRFKTTDSRTDYFALCGSDCGPDGHRHEHPHFHCRGCARTFCIPGTDSPPTVGLPRGYTLEAAQLTFEGHCAACNHEATP